jgi:hypothetical protein
MKRYLLVESKLVSAVLQDFAFSNPADLSKVFQCGVQDVRGKYQIGDSYTPEVLPTAKSVFSPFVAQDATAFTLAGVCLNTHPSVKSDYVYTLRDDESAFAFITAYGAHHGVRTPAYKLVDKTAAQQAFSAAGFSLLATSTVLTREDLVAFSSERIILKPAISTNSRAVGHPLAAALYRIDTKSELLRMLDSLGAFSDPGLLANKPIIAQQVADGDGDNFEALILSGAVNGSGEVWHFAPIELDTQYDDTGRYAKTVWSPENNTAETAQLQQKVARLLADAGSVNCFYQLQFLRSNGNWVPHDFQYRMTYYVDFGLEQLGFQQHKVDTIKYAFDQSSETPEQPQACGLKLRTPRVGMGTKEFVSGETKAEVLAKLGAM